MGRLRLKVATTNKVTQLMSYEMHENPGVSDSNVYA